MNNVTQLLEAAKNGDRQAAAELLPLVYDDLRKRAALQLNQEKAGHSLNATGLVHDAYLRLVGDQRFEGRGHFFAAAAEAMRRILVDAARRRKAVKRGGGNGAVEIDLEGISSPAPDDEILDVDAALERLAAKDPVKADLVKLRFFAGFTADQAAEALGLSPSTADRHWTFARAWLGREIAASRQ